MLLETQTMLPIHSMMTQTHHLTVVQTHLVMNKSLLGLMLPRPVLPRLMLPRPVLPKPMPPRPVLLRPVLLILRSVVMTRRLPMKKRDCVEAVNGVHALCMTYTFNLTHCILKAGHFADGGASKHTEVLTCQVQKSQCTNLVMHYLSRSRPCWV